MIVYCLVIFIQKAAKRSRNSRIENHSRSIKSMGKGRCGYTRKTIFHHVTQKGLPKSGMWKNARYDLYHKGGDVPNNKKFYFKSLQR